MLNSLNRILYIGLTADENDGEVRPFFLQAIEEGKYGVKLAPETKLFASHFNTTKDLATIYMMVGDYDEAMKEVEYLLTIPGELSIPLLQLDPAWAPLRDHPRFKKLIEQGR